MLEESKNEVIGAPHLSNAASHLSLQLRQVVGRETGEMGGIEMAPQVFHRIEFRGAPAPLWHRGAFRRARMASLRPK